LDFNGARQAAGRALHDNEINARNFEVVPGFFGGNPEPFDGAVSPSTPNPRNWTDGLVDMSDVTPENFNQSDHNGFPDNWE
jgi:hypothetical protein